MKIHTQETQNRDNHKRIHPLFHYFIIPVTVLLAVLSLLLLIGPDANTLTGTIALLSAITLHSTAFVARDYAKKNQDRIIRVEMRMRYYMLTGKSFEAIEDHLSISQLAALRFAGDEELLELLESAMLQGLSADAIKKRIRHWIPDHMRV